MAQTFMKETDGLSVDVTLSADITGERPVAVSGIVGLPFGPGESGDTVPLRADGSVHRWQKPSALSVAIGDTVYVTLASVTANEVPDGAYSTSSGAGKKALWVILTEADDDDWCDVKLVNF
jgi:hypothetical protein